MTHLSYLDPRLSGIGFDVYSTYNRDNTGFDLGTSFASPQVAGLAAMLWAVRPGLSAAEVSRTLVDTARPMPLGGGPDCSSHGTPPPTVDAYSAMLALDVAFADLKVRGALIDANEDGSITASDLQTLLAQINSADGRLDYGRADLNGDGYSGGDRETVLDLNADGEADDLVNALIAGDLSSYNEAALTDLDVLCYFAFSAVLGSPGQGASAIEEACGGGAQLVVQGGEDPGSWAKVTRSTGEEILDELAADTDILTVSRQTEVGNVSSSWTFSRAGADYHWDVELDAQPTAEDPEPGAVVNFEWNLYGPGVFSVERDASLTRVGGNYQQVFCFAEFENGGSDSLNLFYSNPFGLGNITETDTEGSTTVGAGSARIACSLIARTATLASPSSEPGMLSGRVFNISYASN